MSETQSDTVTSWQDILKACDTALEGDPQLFIAYVTDANPIDVERWRAGRGEPDLLQRDRLRILHAHTSQFVSSRAVRAWLCTPLARGETRASHIRKGLIKD